MSERVRTKRSSGGRPPKAEAAEAGLRIIETATRLFASQGFAGTSIEQVAAACGAGKDTIYRRFPSKVALFQSVVAHARARTADRLGFIGAPNDSALERLQRVLRVFLAVNLEDDLIALKRIRFSEAIVFEKTEPPQPQPDELMAILVDAVKSAQLEGTLRPGDASLMAAYLIHSVVSIPTTHALLGGTNFRDPDVQEQHFRTVWEWLIGGLSVNEIGAS
jgi:TetR/AcrR family transcriptional regulator of autoinduction and epiphytic fitness